MLPPQQDMLKTAVIKQTSQIVPYDKVSSRTVKDFSVIVFHAVFSQVFFSNNILSRTIIIDFIMSNLNVAFLSLQKINSKNLGQNQKNLVNYLLKGYSFTKDGAETLIDHTVQVSLIRSILLNGKTSHRIEKSDSVGDATVVVLDA